MIPWFDKAVVGMKIWDKKHITLEPKEAYGEYDPKKIQEVKKSDLKSFVDAWFKLEVWTELPTQYGKFKIKEVKKDSVMLDVNHEMSWKTLVFDIQLVDIK
jgi:FKBP-type peptidyl-prolyl cis-trans isomerase 2